jgi:hypothetical protein
MSFRNGPGRFVQPCLRPEDGVGQREPPLQSAGTPAQPAANDGRSRASQTDRMSGHAFRTRRHPAHRRKGRPSVGRKSGPARAEAAGFRASIVAARRACGRKAGTCHTRRGEPHAASLRQRNGMREPGRTHRRPAPFEGASTAGSPSAPPTRRRSLVPLADKGGDPPCLCMPKGVPATRCRLGPGLDGDIHHHRAGHLPSDRAAMGRSAA